MLLGGGGCGVEVGGKVMWGNNLKLVLPGGFSGVLGGVRFAFSGGGGWGGTEVVH